MLPTYHPNVVFAVFIRYAFVLRIGIGFFERGFLVVRREGSFESDRMKLDMFFVDSLFVAGSKHETSQSR